MAAVPSVGRTPPPRSLKLSQTPSARGIARFGALLAVLLGNAASGSQAVPAPDLVWDTLPSLPDPVGVAGAFAGLSGGSLLVAGGAQFPERPPWEGGTKRWKDMVHILTPASRTGVWHRSIPLPHPVAYGVSLTIPDGVLCIGGGDARSHFREVFLLRWDPALRRVVHRPCSPLPIPLAFMAGALLEDTAIVACGAQAPGEQAASARVFALNTARPEEPWRELPSMPGEPRILPIAGARDGAVYVFGGCALRPHGETTCRVYLRDGWKWRADSGWQAVAPLPTPLAAGPSPAAALGESLLLVLGGDDGTRTGQPPAEHPGFDGRTWAYDARIDAWMDRGALPATHVTTPLVPVPGTDGDADEAWLIPSGEVRPGVRSPIIRRGRPITRQPHPPAPP